ncbi:MAG: hypothetical protein Q7S27_03490 [Nanoarchaeota archaeon]|nr:hypothetical protein [Nanoarchaeota archaeon]
MGIKYYADTNDNQRAYALAMIGLMLYDGDFKKVSHELEQGIISNSKILTPKKRKVWERDQRILSNINNYESALTRAREDFAKNRYSNLE